MNETRTTQPTFDWARAFRLILAAGLLLVVALASPRAARAANFIVVNSTSDVIADDGQCTIREAVASANSNLASGVMAGECAAGVPGLDIIRFNIGGGGPQTINFTRALYYLDVDEPVMIDGTSQPGYAGTPLIRLDGGDIAYVGVYLGPGSDGSTIKGLMLTRFVTSVIEIRESNGNVIQSNYIGTDGTSSLLSVWFGGILIYNGANNLIGGIGPGSWGEGNVISGNNHPISESPGIFIAGSGSTGNKIQGNIIGADPTGTFAISNRHGVYIDGAPNNLIGESNTGSGNLISGNNVAGVRAVNSPGTQVRGNWIGTDITLLNPLAGSTQAWGIAADGGTIQVYHNVIAFHYGNGAGVALQYGARFLFGSTYNCIHDNDYGVYNWTGSTVTFANNWWGDPSGPSGAGSGYGDYVSAYVGYRPWLTDPATACPSLW